MYRLLSSSKDTYITDKIIENSRSIDANVGQAGTIDIYKLWGETNLPGNTNPVREITRGLIKFDYGSIVSSGIDISDSTFTASVVLKDVYGGQVVPSNYSLVLFPVSKSWNEGRGFDVASYKDLDSANFISASTNVTWSISGASALGSLGANDIDVIVSGDIGSGLENLGSVMTFARGDEDGIFNVTKIVSASIAGIIENHGFRLSFIESEENDSVTRFVKRFGSKQAFNKSLHPKLHVKMNDGIYDSSGHPKFNISQNFFVYNIVNGAYQNFISSSTEVTGANSLLFELATSKSVSFVTSSFQPNFSASIEHLTSSVVYYSASFTGSQYSNQTGVYSVNFNLDLTSDADLNSFVNKNEIHFVGTWKSLDGTTVFARDVYEFNKPLGRYNNVEEKNYVINVTNLKREYVKGRDNVRLRVFAQDRSKINGVPRYSQGPISEIFADMRWRLVKKFEKNTVVIPFDASTKMSTDKDGMYFDLYIDDLDTDEVYELEFLIVNETSKNLLINNKGFDFKVVD